MSLTSPLINWPLKIQPASDLVSLKGSTTSKSERDVKAMLYIPFLPVLTEKNGMGEGPRPKSTRVDMR